MKHKSRPVRQPLASILPDEKALRSLIDAHWQDLLAYCQHYTQDTEASRELVQDIFCSLWDRRSDLRLEINVEHYLFAAARNKIARYYRNKYSEERRHREAVSRFSEETDDTEQTIHFGDMKRRVSELVRHLPERCGEVFVLSRNEELSIGEIAGKLAISPKTVETHLTKALKFLRKHLQYERY